MDWKRAVCEDANDEKVKQMAELKLNCHRTKKKQLLRMTFF
jgi:hypothetical protein